MSRKVFHHVLAQDLQIGDTVLTYCYLSETSECMYNQLLTIAQVDIGDRPIVKLKGHTGKEMVCMESTCQFDELVGVSY